MYLPHAIALWASLAPGTLALDDRVFRLFQQLDPFYVAEAWALGVRCVGTRDHHVAASVYFRICNICSIQVQCTSIPFAHKCGPTRIYVSYMAVNNKVSRGQLELEQSNERREGGADPCCFATQLRGNSASNADCAITVPNEPSSHFPTYLSGWTDTLLAELGGSRGIKT